VGCTRGRRDEADAIDRTFRFDPKALDAVVVSHAHLDHTGNLPTLVAQGFRGRIHLTGASADLARVMLPDSAHLMERDVEHVNRHRRSRPLRKPLYTLDDVTRTLERFETYGYGKSFELFPGVTATWHDAGHILGSAMTTFTFTQDGRSLRVLMGGDLGRPQRAILRDPEVPPGPDVLVLESTYGDRLHADDAHNEMQLVDTVRRTAERGGRLVVPAFAVGRTQELVAVLHGLMERGAIPSCRCSWTARWRARRPRCSNGTRSASTRRRCDASVRNRGAVRLPSAALHHDRRGIAQPQRAPRAVHHHLGLGHVRGRPRAAPSRARAREPAQH
jgi:metallo-beta-lactamase family protein